MADAHAPTSSSGGGSWVSKIVVVGTILGLVLTIYGIHYLSTSRQTSTDLVLGGNTPPAQGEVQRDQGQGTLLSVVVPGNGNFSAHINSVTNRCNTLPTTDPRLEWWTLRSDGNWVEGGLTEATHSRRTRLKPAFRNQGDVTVTVIQGHTCRR